MMESSSITPTDEAIIDSTENDNGLLEQQTRENEGNELKPEHKEIIQEEQKEIQEAATTMIESSSTEEQQIQSTDNIVLETQQPKMEDDKHKKQELLDQLTEQQNPLVSGMIDHSFANENIAVTATATSSTTASTDSNVQTNQGKVHDINNSAPIEQVSVEIKQMDMTEKIMTTDKQAILHQKTSEQSVILNPLTTTDSIVGMNDTTTATAIDPYQSEIKEEQKQHEEKINHTNYGSPTIVQIPGLNDQQSNEAFESVSLLNSDQLAYQIQQQENLLMNEQQKELVQQQQQRDEIYNQSVATISLPWQYDDLVTNCYQCSIVFVPILQNKHHCRLCGNIFCQNCSSKRCLIPPTRIVLVPKGGKKVKPPISYNDNHISFTPDPDPDGMLTYITSKSKDGENNNINNNNKEQYILYGKGLEQRITLARQPLRVCDNCYRELQSIQEELRNTNSNAVRFNYIDPSDNVKRMMNSPLAFTLGHEIRKAAYTLNNLLPLPKRRINNSAFIPSSSFNFGNNYNNGNTINSTIISEEIQQCKDTCMNVSPTLSDIDGVRIPAKLLDNAKGIAVLTVFKGGFGFAGAEFGTGLVVAKLPPLVSNNENNNSSNHNSNAVRWSAPSAIGTAGVSWGALIGAQVSDHVFVLMTDEAVELLFTENSSIQLGVDVGVAVGPLGRSIEGDISFSTTSAPSGNGNNNKPISIYTYSLSKGFYAGISLDGKIIGTRHNVNENFYGYKVNGYDILNGIIPTPPAAQPLYEALARCHVYTNSNSSSTSTSSSNNNSNNIHNNYRDNIHPQQTLFQQHQRIMMQQQQQQQQLQYQTTPMMLHQESLPPQQQQYENNGGDNFMYNLESRQVLGEYGEVPDGVPLPSNPYHYL